MLNFNCVAQSPEIAGITFAVATYFMHMKVCKKGHLATSHFMMRLITILGRMVLNSELLDLS